MTEFNAKQLKKQGYCVTSRRHRRASRIDREDWKDYFKGVPADADHYRRCASSDTIVVPASFLKLLRNSGDFGAPKEYLPKIDLNKQPERDRS